MLSLFLSLCECLFVIVCVPYIYGDVAVPGLLLSEQLSVKLCLPENKFDHFCLNTHTHMYKYGLFGNIDLD